MTKLERERLNFLMWDLLKKVTAPTAGGTQSSHFSGFIGHSMDAQNAFDLAHRFLYALLAPPDDDQDVVVSNDKLEDVAALIERRMAAEDCNT